MSTITTVAIPVEVDAGTYSPAFLEAVRGGGSWSHEARLLLALAAARGLQLDETSLILSDTRDLRAWRDELTGLTVGRT
jgi:hypothetical protein